MLMPKIKDLPRIELPREKLEKYGAKKMFDHELLAIVLGSGIKGLNVLRLSKRIVKRVRREGVEKISLRDLLAEKGLGKAKALAILAVLELGRRLHVENVSEIVSPRDAWKLCSDIHESKKEHFLALYLDTQGRLIERHIISIGTLNSSLVHPREVFEPAIMLHAASVIAVHNHPSGSCRPSSEDIEVTKRLSDAGDLLGITLLDHIIVSKQGFISLKEHGMV